MKKDMERLMYLVDVRSTVTSSPFTRSLQVVDRFLKTAEMEVARAKGGGTFVLHCSTVQYRVHTHPVLVPLDCSTLPVPAQLSSFLSLISASFSSSVHVFNMNKYFLQLMHIPERLYIHIRAHTHI
jgi:hypothetical protein